MTAKTFKMPIVFIILTCLLFINVINSAPVNSSISYENFMKDIKLDNCSFPAAIVLPFKSSDTLEYLSQPLSICKASEISKHSKEAITICSEVFDTLKNVTCHLDKNVKLPEIRVEFSDDVCQNISFLKSDPSLNQQSLLKHITDKFICDIMCADDFRPACKVLLWSYQVQRLMQYLPQDHKIETTKVVQEIATNTEETKPENAETVILNAKKTTLAKESSTLTGAKGDNLLVSNNLITPPSIGSDAKLTEQNPNSVNSSINYKEDKTHSKMNETKKLITNELSNGKAPILESHEVLNEKPSETTIDGKEKAVETTKLVNAQIDENDNEIDAEMKPPKLDITTDTSQNENKEVAKNEESKIVSATKTNVIMNKDITGGEKTISSTDNKISGDEEMRKNHPGKKLDVSEKKSNLTRVTDKATESVHKQNDLEQKDDTQPAIVPKITNEAEEGKLTKQQETTIPKGKEISDSQVMPKVGDEEELPSVTTVANADLEKMEEGNGIPEPVDKDQDPYNDMENDGEYSKLDYEDEDGFNDPSKIKKTDEIDNGLMPKSTNTQNELPKYDVFPPRNSFVQGSDDIQVIPAFPEQEDSHFFFYFLSLVLLLMGGYLLFHNKQKIIALIVEGRHERRRRSPGIGYKKLETK